MINISNSLLKAFLSYEMLLKRTEDFIACTLKHPNVHVCESIVCVQMAMLQESMWLCGRHFLCTCTPPAANGLLLFASVC